MRCVINTDLTWGNFVKKQCKCGLAALCVTTGTILLLRHSHGALCAEEIANNPNNPNNAQWEKSMSKCSCAVHDVADAHYLAPAYNALALILFFAGAIYNIFCKLWHPNSYFHAQHVLPQTEQNVYQQLLDERDQENEEEIQANQEDQEDQKDQKVKKNQQKHEIQDVIKKKEMNRLAMQNMRICMSSVFAVSVVLATQCYVFFLVCLIAVLADAWWIEI